jgi:hypothetical protein
MKSVGVQAEASVATSRRQACSASPSEPGPSHSPRFSQPGATARKKSGPMLSYTRAAGFPPCLIVPAACRTCWAVHPAIHAGLAAISHPHLPEASPATGLTTRSLGSTGTDQPPADGTTVRATRAVPNVPDTAIRGRGLTVWGSNQRVSSDMCDPLRQRPRRSWASQNNLFGTAPGGRLGHQVSGHIGGSSVLAAPAAWLCLVTCWRTLTLG